MAAPQIRVLIVDDDESQRTLLAQMTASLGFAVSTASDGEDALERHAAQSTDVIVTDLMMPRLDGFDLLRTLESMGDRTPTIVLTGVGGIEQGISVVHDLKAFWFLEKPVQPNVFRALLERAAAQKHLIDETDILNRQFRDQPGRADVGIGSHYRRKRYREGISCARPASAESAIRQSVHCDQLRGNAGNVDGKRTIRS